MISENKLADLFEQAVRDLDPAVNAILVRAEQRGRQRRARRRIWLAAGSGLAVLAITGTALAVRAPLGQQATPFAAGSAHPKTAGKHAKASHTRPKAVKHGSAGRVATKHPARVLPTLPPGYQTTAEQKLSILRGLLPADSQLSNLNPYSAAQDGTLEVDYNDGQGAVDFQVSVEPTALFAPLNCPTPLWSNEGPRPAGALPISCAMRTLPDGSIERDAVYYADAYGFYAFSVYDQRPDGVTVDIQVGNGIIHKLPQVDRAQPPGTLAEWEAIAESPAWQLKNG